eukprot:786218-Rhodomonas_salina.1
METASQFRSRVHRINMQRKLAHSNSKLDIKPPSDSNIMAIMMMPGLGPQTHDLVEAYRPRVPVRYASSAKYVPRPVVRDAYGSVGAGGSESVHAALVSTPRFGQGEVWLRLHLLRDFDGCVSRKVVVALS